MSCYGTMVYISSKKQFLMKAAVLMKDSCPGMSRHLLSQQNSSSDTVVRDTVGKSCPFCFQFFTPENHKVRLKPKMKISPRIERLLQKEAKSHRLNLKQTRLLRKYKLAKSVLMVTCSTCKNITKYPGESRSLLSNSPGTPKVKRGAVTPDVRTPGSARKVNLSYSEEKLSSKGKSPIITPRSCSSAQSSPATTAKSSKKGKFHFSRLKMLLSQEEKEPKKKGDLQSFLSSIS